MTGAVARNTRLYGGLLAHLGVVVTVVAITTSSAFQRQGEFRLQRGATAAFAGYGIRLDRLEPRPQPHRMTLVAHLSLIRDGKVVGTLIPSLNFYPASRDPIGTPSIRRGTPRNLFADLYASLQAVERDGSAATVHLYVNPGVAWLWVGGAIVVAGGVLALLPPRRRRFAALPAPAPARAVAEVLD